MKRIGRCHVCRLVACLIHSILDPCPLVQRFLRNVSVEISDLLLSSVRHWDREIVNNDINSTKKSIKQHIPLGRCTNACLFKKNKTANVSTVFTRSKREREENKADAPHESKTVISIYSDLFYVVWISCLSILSIRSHLIRNAVELNDGRILFAFPFCVFLIVGVYTV